MAHGKIGDESLSQCFGFPQVLGIPVPKTLVLLIQNGFFVSKRFTAVKILFVTRGKFLITLPRSLKQ